MFDIGYRIKKAVGIKPSVKKSCDRLVRKFLTPEEIYSLPRIDYQESHTVIIDDHETYIVALRREIFEEDIDMCIYKGDRNRELTDIEKCRFMINHMDDIEKSLRDISDILKDKIIKEQKEMKDKEKCTKLLDSLVNKKV